MREDYEDDFTSDPIDLGTGIPPDKWKILADTFGGGTLGAILAAIALCISVSILTAIIDYITSINIPILSYLFSPEFRSNIFGHMVFSFTLCLTFILSMLIIFGLYYLLLLIKDKILERLGM